MEKGDEKEEGKGKKGLRERGKRKMGERKGEKG